MVVPYKSCCACTLIKPMPQKSSMTDFQDFDPRDITSLDV